MDGFGYDGMEDEDHVSIVAMSIVQFITPFFNNTYLLCHMRSKQDHINMVIDIIEDQVLHSNSTN